MERNPYPTFLLHAADGLGNARLLAADCTRLALVPRERRRLAAELAVLEGQLARLRLGLTEAALAELVWRYLECGPGPDADARATALLAVIAARGE